MMRFGLKWSFIVVVVAAVALRGYIYLSQRDIRKMSFEISRSSDLTVVEKKLLGALVWQKKAVSSDLGIALGLFHRAQWHWNCRVLWFRTSVEVDHQLLEVYLVRSHVLPIEDDRPRLIAIVLDQHGNLCGWETIPYVDLQFVSARMLQSSPYLTILIQTLLERVELTYEISLKGPHLRKTTLTYDPSLFRESMERLGLPVPPWAETQHSNVYENDACLAKIRDARKPTEGDEDGPGARW